MQQMVQEGKVRFLGITAWDGHPDVIEPLLSSGVYHTAQILYNMLNRTAASEPPAAFDDVNQGLSLAVAQRNDIGVIGIRAHAAGALVDRLDREVAPDSKVARDLTRSLKLTYFKKAPFCSMSQVALRFCLDNPAIATVVPGFKNVAELEDSLACSDLPSLDYEDVAELERLSRGIFAG
jgi:aryl-alcohol dehydrogenase-like predicted oxidoreductase